MIKYTGEKIDEDIVIVFKYLEFRWKEEKENSSPYLVSMGEIILNIERHLKRITAKHSRSGKITGNVVVCPCQKALVSR